MKDLGKWASEDYRIKGRGRDEDEEKQSERDEG
jgi:endogenous inhibitor of DNA gyrase (YacG/DUF329 family)